MKFIHNKQYISIPALLGTACAALLLSTSPVHARTSLSGLQSDINQLQTDVSQLQTETGDNASDLADTTQAVCDLYDDMGQSLPLNCPPTVKLVFLSGNTVNGVIGGVAGADSRCQSSADSAGLPGTYKAWIMDSNNANAPINRFTNTLDQVSYQLVNGQTVANSWSDLTDGSLQRPLNVSESGSSLGNQFVWSNVNSAGTGQSAGQTCGNWTTTGAVGGFGISGSVSTWSDNGANGCSAGARLYCFQQ